MELFRWIGLLSFFGGIIIFVLENCYPQILKKIISKCSNKYLKNMITDGPLFITGIGLFCLVIYSIHIIKEIILYL